MKDCKPAEFFYKEMPADLQVEYFRGGLKKILKRTNKHNQRQLLKVLIAIENEPFNTIVRVAKKERVKTWRKKSSKKRNNKKKRRSKSTRKKKRTGR